MAASDLLFLDDLLQNWRQLLRQWSQCGALTRAAQEALRLDGVPVQLQQLLSQWSEGDFSDLPPVMVLPGSAMPGVAGAYAISTGTIYLNSHWLQSASRAQALAVLTEELGHHLDALLNSSDSPGDEGELFSLALINNQSSAIRQAAWLENDHSLLRIDGQTIEIEAADIPQPYSRYTKIAANGQEGISFIKQEVSINDNGAIAFTGTGFQEDVVVNTGYADLVTTVDADHIFVNNGERNVDISTNSYNATRKIPCMALSLTPS